jgi:hypothetical protein
MPAESVPVPAPQSEGRLWAEQLAIGMAIFVGLLVFMAFCHPRLLSVGAQVLTTNHLAAYGWYAVLGVVLQLVIHEGGTLAAAWWLKIPPRFRFFPFGANATATLQDRPREVGTDAIVGFAGPVTGVVLSLLSALVYDLTDNPLFLCIACVGYFYHLFTLVPILDLEGGWIAPALGPQSWLFGLVLMALELTRGFNLVLLCVISFGLPRFLQIILARAPRVDLACGKRQWLCLNLGYFGLVLLLAWLGSTTFQALTVLIPESMGD